MRKTVTLTAASAVADISAVTGAAPTTSWCEITDYLGRGEGAVGNPNVGTQGVKVHAQTDTAAAVANIAFLWVWEAGGVLYKEVATTGTATATALRTNAAGDGGDYMCDVVIGGITRPLVDINPFAEGQGDSESTPNPLAKLRLFFGQTVVTANATFRYRFYATRYAT